MDSAFDTVWPADSVEFCPQVSRNLFVCGTYKLDQPNTASHKDTGAPEPEEDAKPMKQHRRGKCLLFEVVDGPDKKYRQLQEICLPAVLDMKWCHGVSESRPTLGIADSEGNISLHQLANEQHSQLAEVQSISCASSDTLCLSLDWSNRRFPGNALGSLIVSLSNGNLCLLKPNDHNGLTITDSWAAHDFEPWIAAWNYWDTSVIYSGGDDLKLKAWDIRQGFDRPTFVNKRFDAGVTTIQSHPYVEHLIAVGSYDNSVRLFDVRKPMTPLTQADVGGGAWRVKWHPSASRKDDLLVACMHDGFKIVKFNNLGSLQANATNEEVGWEVVKRFDAHESLAYGVDWSYDTLTGQEDVQTLIASASFYDHALHSWIG